ncbi:unnamed protein product [Sphagnum jensenii]|uniref:Uncharacterized protein n=1 Tax=Sphagnum jensenii TaxID=128206 RepID=A0ABP0XBF5_9BRYO
MVGVVHEYVAHEFACMFEGKLWDLHIHESIVAIGSARFGSHSRRSKEGDSDGKKFLGHNQVGNYGRIPRMM